MLRAAKGFYLLSDVMSAGRYKSGEVCAVGPVVVIDGDIYGNVDAAQLPQILARYA